MTSLWKVPDAATQALMVRFHRNLWEKKMAKLEALQRPSSGSLRKGQSTPSLGLRGGLTRPDPKSSEDGPVSPFYWAAYVLFRHWR